jgi:UDP-2,4-diacetamido-2,4,6-trideoxy-beta-L-altropyranose hydrolase
MGIGHLMRCLTLADALAARGAACRFLLSPESGARAGLILQRGHSTSILDLSEASQRPADPDDPPMAHWLPWGWRVDAAACAEAGDADWMVVDHYGLDARWHEASRGRGMRILAIDDMADRPLAPDILLDHNASADEALYRPLLKRPARLLLGPSYALIRPEIADLQRSGPAAGPIRRILITFGGAAEPELYRQTVAALKALELRPLDLTVIGVADAGQQARIAALSADGFAVSVHGLVQDLPERTAAADLCIGAAGVSALERCMIGTPSLTYVTADNQRLAIAALAAAGAVVDMGDIRQFAAFALVDTIQRLTYMPGGLARLAENGRKLVPAGGPDRVAEALLNG